MWAVISVPGHSKAAKWDYLIRTVTGRQRMAKFRSGLGKMAISVRSACVTMNSSVVSNKADVIRLFTIATQEYH